MGVYETTPYSLRVAKAIGSVNSVPALTTANDAVVRAKPGGFNRGKQCRRGSAGYMFTCVHYRDCQDEVVYQRGRKPKFPVRFKDLGADCYEMSLEERRFLTYE